MELLIKLLGIAGLGLMLQDFTPYITLTKKLKLSDKPFRCTLCATYWFSAPPLITIYGLEGIAYAGFSALVAELIDKKLWN